MGQASGVRGRLQASATHLESLCPASTPRGQGAYTKLKGLLVMRNSCFPWATRRLSTANVSSPRRMYFSGKYVGGEASGEGQPHAGPGSRSRTRPPYPCPARSTGT